MEEARTVGQTLSEAGRRLAEQGIEQGRLEAEVLLAFVLGVARHSFYAHPDQSLSPRKESQFQELIRRRLAREPVAYLTGEKEFFSLRFEVDRSVLIPRPETECVVEAAMEKLGDEGRGLRAGREAQSPAFFDVGTGSGAIAVAILANCPECRGFASDVSAAALEVARRNAARHGVAERLEFFEGDLFGGFSDRVDVVISNPPYVSEADRETLPPEVREYEPAEALLDGGDGLSVIRRLIGESPGRLRPGGWLILEMGFGQDRPIGELFERAPQWAEVEVRSDLVGIPRVAVVQKQ